MKKRAGSVLIELLLSLALLFLVITPIMTAMTETVDTEETLGGRMDAENTLNVLAEAVWSVRNQGWAHLPAPGTYHAQKIGSDWELASGSAQLGDHRQTVVIDPVFRDNNWRVVDATQSGQTGVIQDPSSKRVMVTVEYGEGLTKEISTEFMLTRYQDNEQRIHTTRADFENGTFTATQVVDDGGGAIILAGGGRGDWCKPAQNIAAEYNLPGNGRSTVVRAIEGRLFTGTDYANQGQFLELAVSQADPPAVTLVDALQGYDTNDIFFDGNYAYAATDDTSRDIIIINLATNQEVGYFNDTDWFGVAQGVYVVGNVGYATIGNKLHTFDLSSKTGSRPQLGSIDLSDLWLLPATGYRLQVVGNYAYIAMDWISLAEMRVIDVSNPRSLKRAGSANVNSARGKDVFVNSTGTRAYLATSQSSSQRELYILNVSNKSSISLVGSYDSNGMDPRGISVVTGNRLLFGGTGGEEYQIINITSESNPVRCGGLQIDTGVYGIAGLLEADGDAWGYVVTKDNNNELKVIEGGPGGVQYAQAGDFISKPIDFGTPAVINYIHFFNENVPNTTITYQVAGADPVNGNCTHSGYSFVGPDGTSNTFFTAEDTVPVNDDAVGYENPARCFKYRAYLSTNDLTATPQFEEVRINYSP